MHLCLKLLCAKAFCAQRFFARVFSLTVRAFWRAEQLRWVEANFEDDQCSDEMKTIEKNFLRWRVRRDGMRWEELRWGEKRWEEIRWDEMRWDEVWSVKCKCEVWRKCSLGVALHRGRAQVMFLDNNSATGSHKARGPGWRTAHASSIDEKGFRV